VNIKDVYDDDSLRLTRFEVTGPVDWRERTVRFHNAPGGRAAR
jgi:hypothetical protein